MWRYLACDGYVELPDADDVADILVEQWVFGTCDGALECDLLVFVGEGDEFSAHSPTCAKNSNFCHWMAIFRVCFLFLVNLVCGSAGEYLFAAPVGDFFELV